MTKRLTMAGLRTGLHNGPMKRVTFVLAFLMLPRLAAAQGCPPAASAKDKSAALIYGAGWTFTLDAPSGWEFDCEAGRKAGLSTMLLPAGLTMDNSAAIMYARTTRREPGETFNQFIRRDVQQLRQGDSTAVVGVGPILQNAAGAAVPVRTLHLPAGDQYMAVGYVAEDSVNVLLVLSTRNQRAYQSGLRDFAALVRSYRFLKVTVVR